MHHLLDQLPHTPALVLGKRLDILDSPSAIALYTGFTAVPAAHDARDAVASLTMEAAADPDLARLVGELTIRDSDFRTWWVEHRVNSAAYGTNRGANGTGGAKDRAP